jgi:Cysteine dioxygenase type I
MTITTSEGFETLPARTLEKRELRDLVDALAARPEVWADQVAFSADSRHYASLYRDEHVDVWLLCWATGDDTGWHDHDVSSGAVRVVQGAIDEHNPRMGGAHLVTTVGDGGSFCFGPEHIHRLTPALDGSVSIHAYSPPLWRMGQYTFTDEGLMRRLSVSYAEELRPVDGA